MGKCIVKTGDDEYIEFSSVVDAPTTYFCTRQEMLEHLDTPRRGEFWMREGEAEALLKDVDLRLTSARIGAPPDNYEDALREILDAYNRNRPGQMLSVERFRQKFTWGADDT